MRVRGGWLRIVPSVGSEFSYAELQLDSCVQTEEWKCGEGTHQWIYEYHSLYDGSTCHFTDICQRSGKVIFHFWFYDFVSPPFHSAICTVYLVFIALLFYFYFIRMNLICFILVHHTNNIKKITQFHPVWQLKFYSSHFSTLTCFGQYRPSSEGTSTLFENYYSLHGPTLQTHIHTYIYIYIQHL
jgi:hypothetical protein